MWPVMDRQGLPRLGRISRVGDQRDQHSPQIELGDPAAGSPSPSTNKHRTRNRLLSAAAVLALYVLASPYFFMYLMGLAMASDPCGADSNEGICSASTQTLVGILYVGGILLGLLCTAVAFVSAKRAPAGLYWTILAFAVMSPLVGTNIALSIAGY